MVLSFFFLNEKKMGSSGSQTSQYLMMILTIILILFSLNSVAHISSESHESLSARNAYPPENFNVHYHPIAEKISDESNVEPKEWSFLQNLRLSLGIKSFHLRRPPLSSASSNGHINHYMSPSPSPSPSPLPSHSPSLAPTSHIHLKPHSERHAFHSLPRPHVVQRDEKGKAKRVVLTAVLVSLGCFTLIAVGFLLLAWNKYKKKHHNKKPKNRRDRSNKRVSSHRPSTKVSLNPGLDLFYLDSLGKDLEQSPPQVSCCETKPEFDNLSSHSTREITSVHDEDLESVNDEHDCLTSESQEKILPLEHSHYDENDDDDDDDQSFHSFIESTNSSNVIRLSNASLGSFSDALENFNSNELYKIKPSNSPINSSPTPNLESPKHVKLVTSSNYSSITQNNVIAIPPPPPPPLPPPRVNFLPCRSKASSSSSTLPSPPLLPNGPNKTMQLNDHFASSPANNASKPGIPPPPCPPPLLNRNANPHKTPPPPLPMGKDGTPLPKLKPLHWDKVRAAPDQSMVWDKLRSSSFELDEEMIESLFGYNLQNTMRNDEAKSKTPSPSKHVLEPKRLQNITILSKVLNVTSDQVCQAMSQGNGLSLQQLEALVKMVPTKEEEAKLSGYQGDINELGAAERFVREMLNVPFAFQRIEAMLYRETFEDEVVHLRNSFSMLEETCKELRSSRLFLKLLEAVLKTGNRMNVGTIRGGAKAFKLDALLKLADIKGTDGKTNLLHFVVQEIVRSEGIRVSDSIMGRINQKNKNQTQQSKEEEYRRMGLDLVSGLTTELYNVKKTAAIDLDVLASSVSNLSQGMAKMRRLVSGRLSRDDGFVDAMRFFVGYVERKLEELKAEEDKVMSRVKEITEYFHGNVSKEEANPLRIFVIVRDFLAMLDHVCKELRSSKMPRSPNPLAPFR